MTAEKEENESRKGRGSQPKSKEKKAEKEGEDRRMVGNRCLAQKDDRMDRIDSRT